jgi:hypothetical protein
MIPIKGKEKYTPNKLKNNYEKQQKYSIPCLLSSSSLKTGLIKMTSGEVGSYGFCCTFAKNLDGLPLNSQICVQKAILEVFENKLDQLE